MHCEILNPHNWEPSPTPVQEELFRRLLAKYSAKEYYESLQLNVLYKLISAEGKAINNIASATIKRRLTQFASSLMNLSTKDDDTNLPEIEDYHLTYYSPEEEHDEESTAHLKDILCLLQKDKIDMNDFIGMDKEDVKLVLTGIIIKFINNDLDIDNCSQYFNWMIGETSIEQLVNLSKDKVSLYDTLNRYKTKYTEKLKRASNTSKFESENTQNIASNGFLDLLQPRFRDPFKLVFHEIFLKQEQPTSLYLKSLLNNITNIKIQDADLSDLSVRSLNNLQKRIILEISLIYLINNQTSWAPEKIQYLGVGLLKQELDLDSTNARRFEKWLTTPGFLVQSHRLTLLSYNSDRHPPCNVAEPYPPSSNQCPIPPNIMSPPNSVSPPSPMSPPMPAANPSTMPPVAPPTMPPSAPPTISQTQPPLAPPTIPQPMLPTMSASTPPSGHVPQQSMPPQMPMVNYQNQYPVYVYHENMSQYSTPTVTYYQNQMVPNASTNPTQSMPTPVRSAQAMPAPAMSAPPVTPAQAMPASARPAPTMQAPVRANPNQPQPLISNNAAIRPGPQVHRNKRPRHYFQCRNCSYKTSTQDNYYAHIRYCNRNRRH